MNNLIGPEMIIYAACILVRPTFISIVFKWWVRRCDVRTFATTYVCMWVTYDMNIMHVFIYAIFCSFVYGWHRWVHFPTCAHPMDHRHFHTTIMMPSFSRTVDRIIVHACIMISVHAYIMLIAHTCIMSIRHASIHACTMIITLNTVRSQSGHSQVTVRSWFFTHNLQIRGKPMMPINNKELYISIKDRHMPAKHVTWLWLDRWPDCDLTVTWLWPDCQNSSSRL